MPAKIAAGGSALRTRIDDMPNEEYQDLVRLPGEAARERLIGEAPIGLSDDLAICLADTDDQALPALLGDLGGHDLAELLGAFDQADASAGQPTVLFAYTMKTMALYYTLKSLTFCSTYNINFFTFGKYFNSNVVANIFI